MEVKLDLMHGDRVENVTLSLGREGTVEVMWRSLSKVGVQDFM